MRKIKMVEERKRKRKKKEEIKKEGKRGKKKGKRDEEAKLDLVILPAKVSLSTFFSIWMVLNHFTNISFFSFFFFVTIFFFVPLPKILKAFPFQAQPPSYTTRKFSPSLGLR